MDWKLSYQKFIIFVIFGFGDACLDQRSSSPSHMMVQKIKDSVAKTEVEYNIVEKIHFETTGSYKWVSIDESKIVQNLEWIDETHVCPCDPNAIPTIPSSKGKWILTCKSNLDKVAHQLSGHNIGYSISLDSATLNEYPWGGGAETLIDCLTKTYVVTCEDYWKNALKEMKHRFFKEIEHFGLTPSAAAFCKR